MLLNTAYVTCSKLVLSPKCQRPSNAVMVKLIMMLVEAFEIRSGEMISCHSSTIMHCKNLQFVTVQDTFSIGAKHVNCLIFYETRHYQSNC